MVAVTWRAGWSRNGPGSLGGARLRAAAAWSQVRVISCPRRYRSPRPRAFVVVSGDIDSPGSQDSLLLVQEPEEIGHKRVMTASQASA